MAVRAPRAEDRVLSIAPESRMKTQAQSSPERRRLAALLEPMSVAMLPTRDDKGSLGFSKASRACRTWLSGRAEIAASVLAGKPIGLAAHEKQTRRTPSATGLARG
jgi:hypothetical protein